jgi:hypothetical protein
MHARTTGKVRLAALDAFRIAWFLRMWHVLGDAHRGTARDALPV